MFSRLQKLTELEARDSLQLEGLEIREALAEVSDKLRAIETDPAIQNVIHLMDAKKGPVVSDVEKASLLHAMDQLQKPPPEPQSPQGEGGFLEIYSSVSKTAAHDIEGLLKRYNEIDEKVSELETIVGVESFSSLTFCYNDITSGNRPTPHNKPLATSCLQLSHISRKGFCCSTHGEWRQWRPKLRYFTPPLFSQLSHRRWQLNWIRPWL